MMYTPTIEAVRRQLAEHIPPTLEQTAQILASIDALTAERALADHTLAEATMVQNTYQTLIAAHEAVVASAKQETAQRQQMEAALRASDQHFRATFEQAAVGMAEVGLDGRWLRVNRRLCAITGYTEAELLAHTFQDITYPDDLPANTTIIQRLLTNEQEMGTLEKRYLRNDGQIIWIYLTVSLVRADTGEPAYCIAVIEDITARKQAEDALRRSEAQLD